VHLFTFNFKQVLLLTIFLLIGYSLSLHFISFPIETGQSQFQENKIKLENFVFQDQICDKVIVGSSLSFRLRAEDLESGFCNLALAGSSATTGLEVLLDHPPSHLKTILIEMNVLRPEDRELLNSIQGISYWLKKNFLFFQNRYQPVTIGINYLRQKIPYVPPAPAESQFQFWLKEQQRDYEDLSETYQQGFEANLAVLKDQIRRLENKNIHFQLIELPMDPSILNSKKHQYHRRRFSEVFPNKNILTDNSIYATDDGLHLNYSSASKFAAFLKSML